jgi:hypothetical protein
MRITDELRKWGRATLMPSLLVKMESIADRIDAEHERLMQEQPFTIDMVPMTDESMAELGWVRLPKDADGVPWHIGDRTESGQTIQAMGLNKHGWHFVGTVNDIDPSIHRHYHAPTVEDVLREFALAVCKDEALTIRKGVVEEFAAKLRLAEGEDA